MKLARELEKRLERLVDGLSATVFRGKMHPVDLANRLVRTIDLSVDEGPAGPGIDNDLTVRVNPGELDPNLDVRMLERELAATVADVAAERGWRTGGPIRVEVRPDAAVGAGSVAVDGTHNPGPMPPWGQLLDAATGRAMDLADNRVVVGRAEDADVVLPEPEVSRRHALVVRQSRRAWIQDLGSINGTWLNGVPVGDKPVQIAPGDSIRLGPATFSYRTL